MVYILVGEKFFSSYVFDLPITLELIHNYAKWTIQELINYVWLLIGLPYFLYDKFLLMDTLITALTIPYNLTKNLSFSTHWKLIYINIVGDAIRKEICIGCIN